ncbi:MAG: transglycosylase SLT domain-containing protein [Streptomycetales bacterium]
MTLTVAACLLVSCSTHESLNRETGRDRRASGSPTSPGQVAGPTRPPALQPTPDDALGELATVPATGDTAALARQLDRAVATVRDRDATAADVGRAGQFQQLAVHTLATASGAFRRKVTARLHPGAALVTRSNVRAARLLRALHSPQQTLPRWRIVVPPSAAELLGYYQEAQRRTGVAWTYLAAIHLVETRMGRIRGQSTAGARGPMQFLPSTWDTYGAGGDINDPRDAILAAARLLKDNGAPGAMADALRHYNPSDNYVRAVSEYARTMQRSRSAYRGYWHWRVLYSHARGTYLLPVGYPAERPTFLHGN